MSVQSFEHLPHLQVKPSCLRVVIGSGAVRNVWIMRHGKRSDDLESLVILSRSLLQLTIDHV